MNICQFISKIRVALIRRELQHLEAQRRRTIAEFMLAVDYRFHAQREFYLRGQCIASRKAELESKLDKITREMA